MTTATQEASRRRARTCDLLAEPMPPRVQPPAKWAHLPAGELYHVLVSDTEMWTKARVAMESGRSESSVDRWLDNYIDYIDGKREHDDFTIIRPTYFPGSTDPFWPAGDIRAWLMRTGKMKRDGTFIPHSSPGRPPGIREPRSRPSRLTYSVMEKRSPALLARYQDLIGADVHAPREIKSCTCEVKHLVPREARVKLAEEFRITERAVKRWLARGRELAAA